MKITFPFLLILLLSACSVKKTNSIVRKLDVERIIKTLSADVMQGREIFTPGIEKAAKFIENEFNDASISRCICSRFHTYKRATITSPFGIPNVCIYSKTRLSPGVLNKVVAKL